jgi:hypothetical protein
MGGHQQLQGIGAMASKIRVKSRWFKSDQPKSMPQLASAMAFIIWRVAHNTLKRMRTARFDIDPGPQYFAFLSEFLVFLTVIADRMAHARLDVSARVEFTTALANRVAEILQDNQDELLGTAEPGSCKSQFIALLNERSTDYAEFSYTDAGPDFAFLRYLGSRVTEIMASKDQSWTVSQVMEIEAPDAVTTIQDAMRNVFTVEPRPAPARAGGVRGD